MISHFHFAYIYKAFFIQSYDKKIRGQEKLKHSQKKGVYRILGLIPTVRPMLSSWRQRASTFQGENSNDRHTGKRYTELVCQRFHVKFNRKADAIKLPNHFLQSGLQFTENKKLKDITFLLN